MSDRARRPLADRIAALTTRGPVPPLRPDLGPCLLWTGRLNAYGYGAIKVDRRPRLAHRVTWEDQHGPVPEGLELDHLCRVRRCVQPSHLEPVTRLVNILRGDGPAILRKRYAARTTCRNGHLLSGDNLSRRPNGARICRTCHRAEQARYLAKKAACHV